MQARLKASVIWFADPAGSKQHNLTFRPVKNLPSQQGNYRYYISMYCMFTAKKQSLPFSKQYKYNGTCFVVNTIILVPIMYARSDIFRLEYRSVWQIPVFRYVLLMRNQEYVLSLKRWKNSVGHI
jgi:hypothetical protein